MAANTSIEWTDATWNPIVGCSVVSPGCTNCYAMKMAARIERCGTAPHYAGTTHASKAGAVWTGRVSLAPAHILTHPLRWNRARKIFVNSMGDLFHESVPDEWIDRVFAVMALAPQHTFQVLTKRSKRQREYMTPARATAVGMEALGLTFEAYARDHRSMVGDGVMLEGDICHLKVWPLPNVWLGVSVEDQARADERIPDLLATPAAVRFVSAEPLLGPVDLTWLKPTINALSPINHPSLDWVIAGGESGPAARPMHPDWVRALRDQCAAAGTAFFYKQNIINGQKVECPTLDGRQHIEFPLRGNP